MLVPILAFVIGVSILQLQPRLPPVVYAVVLLPLLLAYRLPERRWVMRMLRRLGIAALSLGAGFFWAAWLAGLRLTDELPALWEGRDIHLIGVIAKLPQPFDRGVRFELDVERVLTRDARVPRRIALSWYGSWLREAAAVSMPQLRVGERWTFTVRLRRPHGTVNPHGFDYEAWLLERGIRATGYVRLHDSPRRIDPFVMRPAYGIERVRELARARILGTLEGGTAAGVVAALVMGDQRAIRPEQWVVFTRTGINHLVSISGLHITMISALVFTLTYTLWRSRASLALRLPARKAAAASGLVAAFVYGAVAGFAVPAQRTLFMLTVAAVALWMGQITSAGTVLGLALLVVTVLDPWAVMSPGFWLSFGAVAVIFYVTSGRRRVPHWALAWARTQWAVTLCLVPVLLAMFQQISLVSPIANAFAIPVISLAVVPLALIGTITPFAFVLELAHAVMACTLLALEWLAAVPDAIWQQHAPPPWAIATAMCGVVWMLLPRGFPGRWVGAGLFAPLFTVVPPGPPRDALHMAVLDVGQGLAVVVRTAHHALLYDAGPLYSAEADSGTRIVVPYLRGVGIRSVDGVIISHADNDHAGGASSVFAAVPIDWLASSIPADHPLQTGPRRTLRCHARQAWEWDGVRFEMLHPNSASYARAPMRSNDRSCVLRITAAGTRVLLTGDAEARSEREMLARDVEALRSEILVVPHHGSITSSSPEFIAAVSPRTAVFTVGYRNRFGHPRPEILQRYLDHGSRLLRTDRHGALLFEIDKAGVRVRAHREERRRYWQDELTDFDKDRDDSETPQTD